MTDARGRIGVVLGTLVLVAMAREGAAQSAAAAVEITTGANIPVAVGKTVELQAVHGEASFLSAPGDQVVVELARDVPADVKIVTLTTPDGLTVCTVYASSNPKSPTECLPGSKGRLASGKPKD